MTTKKIYIKKILDIYNRQIYQYLYEYQIQGIPHDIGLYEDNNQLTVIEEFISGSSLQEKMDSNLHVCCHCNGGNLYFELVYPLHDLPIQKKILLKLQIT